MDLFDVARSCLRRWYIFLPLLLVAAWFSYSAYSSVKPVYYSQAVLGIAPPSNKVANPASGEAIPRNGLLDIGGASMIANMASIGLREPSVVDQVVEAGGLPDYNARMFPGPANLAQLPLIMIEATGEDPTAAPKTLDLVIAQADAKFRSMQQQARVPEDQMVAPFVVSPPSTPKAGMPARTRSTVAIFVALVGLSVLLTVVVDALLRRRKPRAAAHAEPEAEPRPAAEHIPRERDVVELDDRSVIASAEPSIHHGTGGLPNTLSVSVSDLISWAQAQSGTAGSHAAHPKRDVAQPNGAAPLAKDATDVR